MLLLESLGMIEVKIDIVHISPFGASWLYLYVNFHSSLPPADMTIDICLLDEPII